MHILAHSPAQPCTACTTSEVCALLERSKPYRSSEQLVSADRETLPLQRAVGPLTWDSGPCQWHPPALLLPTNAPHSHAHQSHKMQRLCPLKPISPQLPLSRRLPWLPTPKMQDCSQESLHHPQRRLVQPRTSMPHPMQPSLVLLTWMWASLRRA